MPSLRSFIFVLSVLSVVLCCTPAHAERRVALVIGNGAYKTAPLKNPTNDAQDMADALRGMGFDVTLKVNASHKGMEEAVRDFGAKLEQGGLGLFYYAGHGVQVGGENYLIPVDSSVAGEADVKFGALNAGMILARMEDAGNDLNIVILDACRTNPFARSFRTAEQGLARMDAPKGSLIAYATAPGRVAADSGGTGRNGVYTSFLLQHMRVPGLKVEEILKRVRADVVRATKDKQVPWESSSLIGDFYFISQPIQSVQASAVPQPIAALAPATPPAQTERKDKTLGEFFTGLFKKQESQPIAEVPASQAPAPTEAAKVVNVEPLPQIQPAPLVPEPQAVNAALQDVKDSAQAQAKAQAEAEAKRILEWLFAGTKALDQKDYAEAARLLRKAADRENAYAQHLLGDMFHNGQGTRKNDAEAVRWYRKAADQGDAAAQFNLGLMYAKGQGVAQNDIEASRWYRKAADQGLAEAQYNLGVMYDNGEGILKNKTAAAKLYRNAADRGLAKAQFNLSMLYAYGQGVTQDYEEAAKLYKNAAQQGIALAQQSLGWMYKNGKGVQQDDIEALKWYTKAADQGIAEAQAWLSAIYILGQGVAQNHIIAEKWARKAAEQGDAGGQSVLASVYSSGQGIPQNYTEATKWARKAAEQGYPAAQFKLGGMYALGQGVPKNLVQAHKWASLAAAQGDSGSVELRDLIASTMTPAQIAEAQKLASQWQPKKPEKLGAKPTPAAEMAEEDTVSGRGQAIATRKKDKARP